MLAAERHRIILRELEANQCVKVSGLSEKFQVTEKTIREDLEKIEQKGLLKRIHGGAVLLSKGEDGLLPLEIPNQKNQKEKAAIASYALSFIQEGDIIALDAGSTTLEIARCLPDKPLTVLTNDLLIIKELTGKERVQLIVPGGYRHNNMLLGSESYEWIKKLNVHKLFLSTAGIHPEYGLTIFTEELKKLKNLFMECSKTIYCVADHSKFGKGALITFAHVSDIHYFITDEGLEAETIKRFKDQPINLIQVPCK